MASFFFTSPADFRNWLAHNHATETEVLVGFYKTSSGKMGLSWSESVDEALCFGWIDGVRKAVDAERYQIRFTPRKWGSICSRVNIQKVALLTAQNRMQPAGIAAFEARQEAKSEVYAFEQETVALLPQIEAHFRKSESAWPNSSPTVLLAPTAGKTASMKSKFPPSSPSQESLPRSRKRVAKSLRLCALTYI